MTVFQITSSTIPLICSRKRTKSALRCRIQRRSLMKNHKVFARAVALAATGLTALLAQADVASNLKVIQSAAQTGMWTISTSGKLGEMVIPSKTETACVTKEEILENYNHAVWLDKGVEEKDCPTSLTTNTSTLGVATAICPPSKIVMGQKAIRVPEVRVSVEFKQINSNQWTTKMDKVVTTMTYHGESTADCTKTR